MTRASHKNGFFQAGLYACLVFFSMAVWPSLGSADTSAASKEYQVKAALLLNFIQFIHWPDTAFPDPSTPVTIGVLGDDPFGDILEKTFNDESVDNRRLVVKRAARVEDLKSCHLLFISKSEKERLPDVLAALKDASVVTVGEMDQFAERGGVINFYIENKKIRFEINDDAAQHKGLNINSQLLKRAKIVRADQGKGGE